MARRFRRAEAQAAAASGKPWPTAMYEAIVSVITGFAPDGARVLAPFNPAEWHLQAVGAAATVTTATLAAPGAGSRRYVTHIAGGYSAGQTGLLEVLSGGVVLKALHIVNTFSFEFDWPLEMPDNGDVVIRLSAGAAGVIGSVTASGFTVNP